jgi:hypothetical protein
MSSLDEAIQHIRMGNREEGRQILEELLEVDENNEEVWLWLTSVVETDEDREICFENVLALNPDNIVAQKGLEALRSGTFNVNDIFSAAFEEVEEGAEGTFLDEFTVAGDEFEEGDAFEELEMPSTMAKPKKKKKGGINIRLIILLVLVLVLILVLVGGAAAYFMLGLGSTDSTPGEQPPAQATPAEGQGPAAAPTETPTPTSTATPTLTPTPTITPFELPTAEPTNTPTATATKVVSPTPS